MTCARSELAARLDLATLGKVTANSPDVFVIDFFDVISAKIANLATGAETATATTTGAASTAAWSTISAFTAPFRAWAGAEACTRSLLA
jgi:hypothetical protein